MAGLKHGRIVLPGRNLYLFVALKAGIHVLSVRRAGRIDDLVFLGKFAVLTFTAGGESEAQTDEEKRRHKQAKNLSHTVVFLAVKI